MLTCLGPIVGTQNGTLDNPSPVRVFARDYYILGSVCQKGVGVGQITASDIIVG